MSDEIYLNTRIDPPVIVRETVFVPRRATGPGFIKDRRRDTGDNPGDGPGQSDSISKR
jgi:hypothetical protein